MRLPTRPLAGLPFLCPGRAPRLHVPGGCPVARLPGSGRAPRLRPGPAAPAGPRGSGRAPRLAPRLHVPRAARWPGSPAPAGPRGSGPAPPGSGPAPAGPAGPTGLLLAWHRPAVLRPGRSGAIVAWHAQPVTEEGPGCGDEQEGLRATRALARAAGARGARVATAAGCVPRAAARPRQRPRRSPRQAPSPGREPAAAAAPATAGDAPIRAARPPSHGRLGPPSPCACPAKVRRTTRASGRARRRDEVGETR